MNALLCVPYLRYIQTMSYIVNVTWNDVHLATCIPNNFVCASLSPSKCLSVCLSASWSCSSIHPGLNRRHDAKIYFSSVGCSEI